jgi:amino-acid N-acetyltransferase
MQIIHATDQSRNEITDLLQSQLLPSEDLPSALTDFYTVVDNGKVVGLIGMERYGHYGLLRSMVVHPNYRNRQIAATLVKMLEEQAVSSGITAMYLLTETADQYFSNKGYNTITREEVPNEVKQSSEFSHVCPVSAIVMKKPLATT